MQAPGCPGWDRRGFLGEIRALLPPGGVSQTDHTCFGQVLWPSCISIVFHGVIHLCFRIWVLPCGGDDGCLPANAGELAAFLERSVSPNRVVATKARPPHFSTPARNPSWKPCRAACRKAQQRGEFDSCPQIYCHRVSTAMTEGDHDVIFSLFSGR